jgi:hypothetical protein
MIGCSRRLTTAYGETGVPRLCSLWLLLSEKDLGQSHGDCGRVGELIAQHNDDDAIIRAAVVGGRDN